MLSHRWTEMNCVGHINLCQTSRPGEQWISESCGLSYILFILDYIYHVCVCVHTRARASMRVCACPYVCKCERMCVCMCTCARACVRACMCMCSYVHTYVRVCAHSRVHARACMWRLENDLWKSVLFLILIPVIKIKPSGLEVSILTSEPDFNSDKYTIT